MTYNSNWGFSNDENSLKSSGSFHDQDETEHIYLIEIIPKYSLVDLLVNDKCYVFTITSDYCISSVQSVMLFLLEQKQMLCYSLATATQSCALRSRHIVAFNPQPSVLKSCPILIHEALGLTVQVQALIPSRRQAERAEARPAANSAEVDDIMPLVRSLDHRKHALLQCVHSAMVLHPDWFTFSDDIIGGQSCLGGVVARRRPPLSSEMHGLAEKDRGSGGCTEQLDVCEIKSLNLDQATGTALLSIKVRSCNYTPVYPKDITDGAPAVCICTAEEFTILHSCGVDMRVESSNRYLFSSSCPFLSRFDEANRRRGFSQYLPASHPSFIAFFRYHFGMDVTVPFDSSSCGDAVSGNVERARDDTFSSCDQDLIEDDDLFFGDVGLGAAGGEGRKTSQADRSGSCSIGSCPKVVTVRVMSASGPRVYPLQLLASRYV